VKHIVATGGLFLVAAGFNCLGANPFLASLGIAALGVSSTFLSEHFAQLRNKVWDRYFSGESGIEENHVVVRELKLATIDALRRLSQLHLEWLNGPAPSEAEREEGIHFLIGLHGFDEYVDAAAKTTIKLEFGKNDPLLKKLSDAFDQALAERRLQSRQPLGEELAEMVAAEIAHCHPPANFLERVRSPGPDGFYSLFVRAAAQRLKEGSEFERIWQAEQLAAVKAAVGDLSEAQDRIEKAVGQMAGMVRAEGLQLSAIAGDVAQIAEFARAVSRAAAIASAPPLDFETGGFKSGGFVRFSARNPRIPFVGREAEMLSLLRFVGDARPFHWWLVTGPGGAGKTRLARHLCMHLVAQGWQAGFLSKRKTIEPGAIDSWRPSRPTLIVVDYVTENATNASVLVESLARQQQQLTTPVRVLLIEREESETLRSAFLGTDTTTRGVIEDDRYVGEGPTLEASELRPDKSGTWCATAFGLTARVLVLTWHSRSKWRRRRF
jgi:hypothetical protein